MKLKLTWLLTLFMAFVMQLSFGQEKDITGTVTTASDGLPLPGVSVIVKGTARGTQTDFDGKYTIKASTGDILVFSYVSMKTVELPIGQSDVVNYAMEEDVAALDEVVVTAYGGTVTKAKSVSSSTQVSSEGIQNRPNVNVLNSLQGQAAGVVISSSSGQPGTNRNNVIIRGQSSLSASSDPLYVIDGVPLTQAFFRSLNPNEIENVTVLKDAAATAIYGNRGTNGVIVITTKKGQFNESFSASYSASYGFTDFIQDDYNMPNAIEHLQLQRKGFDEGIAGLASSLAVSGTFFNALPADDPRQVTVDPNNLEAYQVDTDWQDEFFRQGITQSHDLSFTAGGEKYRSFTSLGYFQQEGIIPTTDFQRFTGRTNFSGKSLNEKFNYGINVFVGFSRRNQLEAETRTVGAGNISNNVLQNPLTGYLASAPFLPRANFVNSAQLLADYGNPALNITPYMLLALFEPNAAPSFWDEFKGIATINASYQITDNLNFGITTGIDYADERRVFAVGPEAYLSLVRAQGNGQPFDGIETIQGRREFMFNHTNKLNYNKTFGGDHTLDVSLYTEYIKAHRRFNSQRQRGLNPLVWEPGAGTGYIPYTPGVSPNAFVPAISALKRDAGLFSYFGTLDYDYQGKYGFAATLRRDGSFRFTEENRWGTFWSVAGRWNITKEDFIGTSDILNDLKLRASYGTTGNQNVLARNVDGTSSTIFLGTQLVRNLNAVATGYNNAPSFAVSSFANEDLIWETTTQINIGLDFRMFKNKFTGSVDVYQRDTEDLYQLLPVSSANGIGGNSQAANDGEIRNKGIEFEGRFRVFDNEKFKLSVFGNIAYNIDTFESLGASDPDGDGSFRPSINSITGDAITNEIRNEGGQLFEYFYVPYAGINPANGNMLFVDINGNLTESPTDADRRATGKSLLPTYQGGFGFDAEYNGFFLNALFTYAADFYRYDSDFEFINDPRFSNNFPVTRDLFNAWTPTNRDTDIPAMGATNFDQASLSDRFLYDSSFLRLRNLTFGYTFSPEALKKTLLTSLTLRVIAENYLTFTNWRGLDPEALSNLNNGFPTPKILTFGIDANF